MELRKLPIAQEILMQNRACSLFHFSAEAANDSGRVWYVLALFLNQEDAFQTAISQPGVDVDIKEYGQILAAGQGHAAPQEALDAIKQKYGIDLGTAA